MSAEPHLVCIADVTPSAVRWLWAGRIPFGAITLIDGDPDTGKSTLTLEVAARLTSARAMPFDDVAPNPAAVILLGSPEDDATTALRPRLDAAGADARKVFVLDAVGGALPRFPEHAAALRAAVERERAALVVIDPLAAFAGENINLNDDTDARRMLHPLAAIARDSGAAIVIVRHNNKNNNASALHRGAGSVGIIGVARSGLAVARDRNNRSMRVVTSTKCNVAEAPKELRYEIETAPNGAGLIRWLDSANVTPAALRERKTPEPTSEELGRVFAALKSSTPTTVEDLRHALGMNRQRCGKIVAKLVDAGRAYRDRSGVRSIPPS